MQRLTQLDRLEAESIFILRETVAEAERPVMLYSMGKDSSVLLHLARKAFFPGPLPFPLLHVDTGWKFRDMYAFRDAVAAEPGIDLIVHKNPDAEAQGINPLDHGPLHTDLWKTEGLKQALDKRGFDAAFGGARKRAGRRSASSASATATIAGTPNASGPSCGRCIMSARPRTRACACSRCPTGPSSTSGNMSSAKGLPLFRSISRPSGRRSNATG